MLKWKQTFNNLSSKMRSIIMQMWNACGANAKWEIFELFSLENYYIIHSIYIPTKG